MVAINSDPDDETTNKSSLSVYDPIYFHIRLTGGEPGGKIVIKTKVTYPDGDSVNDKMSRAWVANSTGWWGWENGLYNYSETGARGTLSMTFFDEKGNTIGSGSVRITS